MSMNQSLIEANGSYELYDKATLHSDEFHSPPGGPSCRPPGSPKQTKENESLKNTLVIYQQEIDQLRKRNEDLQRTQYGCEEFSKASSVDEDLKDSHIRHLRRQITILQAGAHKKEGLEKRMIELTKEKNFVDDRLRAMAVQLETSKKEMSNMREQLVTEIKQLQSIVQQQKKDIERLQAEKGASSKSRTSVLSRESYDSASPPSSTSTTSSSSPAAGFISLQSASSVDNQLYSRELESLHKMVDMLRATVMEQRNTFVKLGLTNRAFTSALAQNQQSNAMSVSMPSSNNCHTCAVNSVAGVVNNIAITNGTTAVLHPETETKALSVAMTARPVRQAEENCEIVTSHSNGVNNDVALKAKSSVSQGRSKKSNMSPASYQHFTGNEGADGNTNHLVSGGASSNLHQFVQYLPSESNGEGSGNSSPKKIVPGNELSKQMSGMDKLNANATSNVTGNAGPIAITALNSDINGMNNDSVLFDSLYKSDVQMGDQILDKSATNNQIDPSSTEASGQRVSPPRIAVAVRKAAHSEVIDRRPNLIEGVTLPVKSRTEIFGQNPNNISTSHHHNQQQQQQQLQQQQLQQQQQQLHQQQVRGLLNGKAVQPFNPIWQPSDVTRPQYRHSPSPVAPTFTELVGGLGRSARMMPIGGIPGGCTLPPNNSWQNGLFVPHQTPMLPPFEAEGCIISPAPTNYSNTLSNISEVRSSSSLSPSPSFSSGQQQRGPDRPQGNNSSSSNRLCPVCNQAFGHISIEDFQTHVFDCFDNDDGPETLQAEMDANYPQLQVGQGCPGLGAQQGNSCPMCHQNFDPSVSQSEFEQHVYRHFGEEPFEEL